MLLYGFDVSTQAQLVAEVGEQVRLDRLRQHLIHACADCLIHIDLVEVPRHSRNYWLR